MALNRYCQECLKLTLKICKGRQEVADSGKTTEWGQEVEKPIPSGLKFCSQYEFDDRFMPAYECEKTGTFKNIRERQVKKAEQDSNQEIADDVDFGESLKSSDFEGLPE